jgi:hypothetical protein
VEEEGWGGHNLKTGRSETEEEKGELVLSRTSCIVNQSIMSILFPKMYFKYEQLPWLQVLIAAGRQHFKNTAHYF